MNEHHISPEHLAVRYDSGTASSSGATAIHTPASGKRTRIHYASYNPAASCDVYFRFGGGGTAFLHNSLTQAGAVIAKDFGDFRYVEGAVDEVLYIVLGSAVANIWNIFYTEV